MEVKHDNQADTASNECPEFVSIIAAYTTTKVVGNDPVPLYEGDTRYHDE